MYKVLMPIIVAAVVCCNAGCRRFDFRTVELNVPGLTSKACMERIQARFAIWTQDGSIRQVDPDYDAEKITVVYNSMKVAIKNLEHAVAQVGFDCNEIPANAKARERLPPECK